MAYKRQSQFDGDVPCLEFEDLLWSHVFFFFSGGLEKKHCTHAIIGSYKGALKNTPPGVFVSIYEGLLRASKG